jgi:hypothetical protein
MAFNGQKHFNETMAAAVAYELHGMADKRPLPKDVQGMPSYKV